MVKTMMSIILNIKNNNQQKPAKQKTLKLKKSKKNVKTLLNN